MGKREAGRGKPAIGKGGATTRSWGQGGRRGAAVSRAEGGGSRRKRDIPGGEGKKQLLLPSEEDSGST